MSILSILSRRNLVECLRVVVDVLKVLLREIQYRTQLNLQQCYPLTVQWRREAGSRKSLRIIWKEVSRLKNKTSENSS